MFTRHILHFNRKEIRTVVRTFPCLHRSVPLAPFTSWFVCVAPINGGQTTFACVGVSFTLSRSSLSLCLLLLSRSIFLHSSSTSGQGGRPCSSRRWHLSTCRHGGACEIRSLCIPVTPLAPRSPSLIKFKLRLKADGGISVRTSAFPDWRGVCGPLQVLFSLLTHTSETSWRHVGNLIFFFC